MKRLLPILALTLSACTSAPATTPEEYLLRPTLQESSTPVQQVPYAALGQLSIPPYLNREGIVVETAPNRIQAAHGHRWAEPLSQSLRRVLRVGIARASGRAVDDVRSAGADPGVVVDVDVHQLHGSLDGKVVLAADWQLRDPRTGRVLERHQFVHSRRTREAGYDALVRAHAELLGELSAAIAESLPSPGTPSAGSSG